MYSFEECNELELLTINPRLYIYGSQLFQIPSAYNVNESEALKNNYKLNKGVRTNIGLNNYYVFQYDKKNLFFSSVQLFHNIFFFFKKLKDHIFE